ncbi:sugar phosphate isomerase/epimerase [Streptomyces sp. 11-1-2]|uniref:sugar phosphate isomerase/epimerase family protein n=1 Tax=unclassified Streptomyces TaxID=2593676 RepID=UPI000B8D1C39|nr:sugar phosphate isomerase/epimerase [Streptomyces sp. 11-1-2]ASQ99372.1 xylose isomerase [Streptomyces sp. 11-1-2]
MTMRHDRIAINPLQWIATEDGWIDPALAPALPERLKVIREAGIGAVHADVPAEMSATEYGRLLGEHGLAPAPGYISGPLPEDESSLRELLDKTDRVSTQMAELGLSTVFVATGMNKQAPRVHRPAVGAEATPERLERVREVFARMGETTKANGVAAAFHPHIGTWAETEEETRFILGGVDADVLSFGPDIGHLGWAGADVIGLIRDYADRVAALHIKDFHADIAERGRAEAWTYQQTVLAGLWAEPGHASVDIPATLAALPAAFDGWLVIEVDRGAQATPEESVRLCGEWAKRQH